MTEFWWQILVLGVLWQAINIFWLNFVVSGLKDRIEKAEAELFTIEELNEADYGFTADKYPPY